MVKRYTAKGALDEQIVETILGGIGGPCNVIDLFVFSGFCYYQSEDCFTNSCIVVGRLLFVTRIIGKKLLGCRFKCLAV